MFNYLFTILGKEGPLHLDELKAIEENTQRIIYWNIGKDVIYYMYPLAFIAIGIFCYGLYRRYKMWKTGDKPFKIEINFISRAIYLVKSIVFHNKIFKKKYAGWLHFFIFYGFVILMIGTMLVMAEADTPLTFLQGTFYKIFSFTLDLFAVILFLGGIMALYRRVVQKPFFLKTEPDDHYAIWFLLSAVILGYLLEAIRIAITQPSFGKISFVGKGMAEVILLLNPSLELLTTLHKGFWWIHFLLTLFFIATLPWTKFLHIIAGPLNIFLYKTAPLGSVPILKLDETDENLKYGVEKITDFSWKDMIDFDACIRCGRCTELCPAFNTQKPLDPRELINDLKGEMERNFINKKDKEGDIIDQETLWSCTTCGACMAACPMEITHVDKIVEMRRNLVLGQGKIEYIAAQAIKKMDKQGNPWGLPPDERAVWAKEFKNVIDLSSDIDKSDKNSDKDEENSDKIEYDYLLWVGSMCSYDNRSQKVVKSFIKLLEKVDIKVGILGKYEKASGDAVRRLGAEDIFQSLALHNIEYLNKFGAKDGEKTIISISPHGFNSLKNEYPQFNSNFNMLHHSEFLLKLIKEGKITPKNSIDKVVTYHDSCYLGRYNQIYDTPREILKKIPGIKLVEMNHNRERGLCCGAGGGRMWMEETIGERINVKRTQEAIDCGSNIVAVGCPFCLTMIDDGLKELNQVENISVFDIAELLYQSIEE